MRNSSLSGGSNSPSKVGRYPTSPVPTLLPLSLSLRLSIRSKSCSLIPFDLQAQARSKVGQSILRSLGGPSVRFIHLSEDHPLRETDPGRLATSHQHLPPAIYCYGFLSSSLCGSSPRNTWLVGDPFASPNTGAPYPPSRTTNGMEKSAFAWVSLSLKSALFRTLFSGIPRRSDHDFVLGHVIVSL